MLSTDERAKHLSKTINNEIAKYSIDKRKTLLSERKGNYVVNTYQITAPITSTSNLEQDPVPSKDKTDNKVSKSQSVKQSQFKPGADKTRDQDEHSGFTAVKRKKIVSYHISNIDSGVSINDIYNYMYDKKVYCTNIRVYYGKIGASARGNVHDSDIDIVEDEYFWPEDVVCRKWQSKLEWEAELDKRYRERQQKSQRYRYNRYNYRDESEYDDANKFDHDAYDKHEDDDRDNREKWWRSWNNADNVRQSSSDRSSRNHRY